MFPICSYCAMPVNYRTPACDSGRLGRFPGFAAQRMHYDAVSICGRTGADNGAESKRPFALAILPAGRMKMSVRCVTEVLELAGIGRATLYPRSPLAGLKPIRSVPHLIFGADFLAWLETTPAL